MKSKLLLSTSVLFLLAFAITRNSAQGQVSPGPEHAVLKRMEGTWTAKVKMGDQVSDATASYKMECGGLWLISDFQGQMGGEKFQGRGTDGYDPGKQKYVSVWVDAWSTRPLLLEGTYDKEKKTLTMTGGSPGPDGKLAKNKMVTQVMDDDHHTFTMFIVGADGQETKMMSIDYTRKK